VRHALFGICLIAVVHACAPPPENPKSDGGNVEARVDAGVRDGGHLSDDGGSEESNDGGPVIAEAPSCQSPNDCPYWYCECQSGPPVNSAKCINNRCLNAAEACPSSCAAFGTCWEGYATGGWDGGTNVGPSTCTTKVTPDAGTPDAGKPDAGCGDGTSFTDVGNGCSGTGASCASKLCYGIGVFKYCTKRCDDEDNCPLGWKCELNSDGFKICTAGTVTSTPISHNAACGQVGFTDLGQTCGANSHCQSGACILKFDQSAYVCVQMCNLEEQCPGSSTCSQVYSDLKLCRY
jgi:hypothetical protein